MVNLNTDSNQLLSQMQQLKLQATQPSIEKNINSQPNSSFSHYVKEAIRTVNTQQIDANTLKTKFTKEDPSVSLSQVMIQMQKAEISLSALITVRNKVMDGYKTIMNMPL